jgi:hypothetical protein
MGRVLLIELSVSKTYSVKTQAVRLDNTSPLQTTATPASAHTSRTSFVSPGDFHAQPQCPKTEDQGAEWIVFSLQTPVFNALAFFLPTTTIESAKNQARSLGAYFQKMLKEIFSIQKPLHPMARKATRSKTAFFCSHLTFLPPHRTLRITSC